MKRSDKSNSRQYQSLGSESQLGTAPGGRDRPRGGLLCRAGDEIAWHPPTRGGSLQPYISGNLCPRFRLRYRAKGLCFLWNRRDRRSSELQSNKKPPRAGSTLLAEPLSRFKLFPPPPPPLLCWQNPFPAPSPNDPNPGLPFWCIKRFSGLEGVLEILAEAALPVVVPPGSDTAPTFEVAVALRAAPDSSFHPSPCGLFPSFHTSDLEGASRLCPNTERTGRWTRIVGF